MKELKITLSEDDSIKIEIVNMKNSEAMGVLECAILGLKKDLLSKISLTQTKNRNESNVRNRKK